MSEKKLNKQIDALLDKIEGSLPGYNVRVIKAMERARLTISDILSKYANERGVIPRNKMSAVMGDLQKVEDEIYRAIQDELKRVLGESAVTTTAALSVALMLALDSATLMSVAGLTGTVASLGANAAYIIFEALTERTRENFGTSIAASSFNRKDDDGKKLNDRLRDIAKSLRRDITDTLRKSIQKGEVTTAMTGKVKRNFTSLVWRIQTIVETEVTYVMRNGIAKFAELSGIAKGLRIQDYFHGDPAEHRKHLCHVYANRDDHGLGKGIYPVTTRKIRHPHPRCRSTLHIVLKEKL